jgi:methylglutaconyl-CoA hydratase
MSNAATGAANTDIEHGVREERRGAIAIWTVDRPDRMNALGRATVTELGRLAKAARTDASIRAVVITGGGERAFSAGADLKERQSMNEDDVRAFLLVYKDAFGAIDSLPKPVFAAMNGVAFGGGLELALACDFRVLDRAMSIGLTETSLGIIPGAGGTQRLTRIVGAARAKELILFAKRISATEALALGIVTAVTAEGESALDSALSLADQLANGAPIALAAALTAIDGALDHDLDAGLDLERACYEQTLVSADRREALKAFQEKRKPRFEGL